MRRTTDLFQQKLTGRILLFANVFLQDVDSLFIVLKGAPQCSRLISASTTRSRACICDVLIVHTKLNVDRLFTELAAIDIITLIL